MSITPIFERGLENEIRGTMICDYNVLIALRALTGNLPQSSVYMRLMGYSRMWTSLVGRGGVGAGGDKGLDVGAAALGLVDRTPLEDCTMCPLMVSSDWGQYLDALAWVRPGQVL